MLGVEDVVAGSSATTIATTFPAVVAATSIGTTAASAVVAGGVDLIPLVAASTGGSADPRSLLVPVVPILSGLSPAAANHHTGTTTATSPIANNNNNNSSSNNNNNNNVNNSNGMGDDEPFMRTMVNNDGDTVLEVECGQNKATMFLAKLCQGSKGPCINFQGSWLTPNEFQFVSGRETAKDWKRSIRHHGKSLKLLLAKGVISVHPTMCDCDGCRIGAVLTRKGEKRRIPNGERKRKSTGNAPENSGNGAFRPTTNGISAVKSQDGPTDPKRLVLEKSQEGGQSPLKESSLMNLPDSKEVSALRLHEGLVADVSKMAIDNRLHGPTPLMPLLSPERGDMISSAAVALAMTSSSNKDLNPLLKHSSDAKRRHSSGSSSSNHSSHLLPGNVVASSVVVAAAAAAEPGAMITDVKVLSSSGRPGTGCGSTTVDKSLDRLALYQAAVSASRITGDAGDKNGELPCKPEELGAPGNAPKCDKTIPKDEKQSGSGNTGSERDNSGNADVRSPSKETKEVCTSSSSSVNCGDVKVHPVCPSSSSEANNNTELNGFAKGEVIHPQPVKLNHSMPSSSQPKPCEPSSNISSIVSPTTTGPLLLSPSLAATAVPSAVSPAASYTNPKTVSPSKHDRESSKHKQTSPSLPSPHHHGKPPSASSSSSSEKSEQQHLTIRHPSPERRSSTESAALKHSPVRSSREHHSAERAAGHKDRRHENTSTSESRDRHDIKDRHREKDSSSRHINNNNNNNTSTSNNNNTGSAIDRDAERRRQEAERSAVADKDRKSAVSSGQSSKSEDAAGSASFRGSGEYPGLGGTGRPEGVVPTTAPPPAPVADPAAFSEYMRVLAAGHHGLVPPPAGCIPPMFSLRPPGDVSVTSGAAMLHPMHAAACGMFSSPSALLPKDPVLYGPTAATGALPPTPAAAYPYGAMAPMSFLPPHQYPTAAAAPSTAAMLAAADYASRPFSWPAIPWSSGLSLMMPDAAMAAAAMAANSASAAKRSREEMESAAAADLNAKRFQLPAPMAAAYGAGAVAPIDYMAGYRSLAATAGGPPISCGMESSMFDKNAELLRRRLYGPPEMAAATTSSPVSGGAGSGSKAGGVVATESPYMASMPDYYRSLYGCRCMENRPGDIRTWGVEDVAKLVASLEGCSMYTEIFREQKVDGKILVLLNTELLMKNLGMKFGPALTLTSRVAKLLLESTRVSGCDTCRRLACMIPAVQSAAGY